jgi:flagella basal body P-ring formation protein FlgA
LSSAFSCPVGAIRAFVRLFQGVGLGLCLAQPAPAATEAIQDGARLANLGADWLRARVAERHPDVDIAIEVTPPDPRLRLPDCPTPLFSLPSGASLWGSGSLGARCEAPAAWALYTPYRIRLSGPGLVSRHAARARQGLGAEDVAAARVEYQAAPESYLRDPAQLRGAQLAVPVASGTALRHDMLRRPPLIKAGQRVRIIIEGTGFRIGQEGIAQQAGAEGETIRLKTASGKLLHGRVEQDGSVSVEP